MLIYNKYRNKRNIPNTPAQTVKPIRLLITEENKKFLELLNIKVKHNV